MKLTGHRYFIVSLLAIILSVSTATNEIYAQTKMTASGVLDKVIATMQNSPSLSMKMAIQSKRETFRANLTVAKQKFKYATAGMSVYYDGKTQWTVYGEAKEVSLTNPTAEELAETNPLAFVQNYKKNYKVSLESSAAGSYTILMTALKKTSYVREARVVVSASTWMPTKVTAKLSNGQNMTVLIENSTKGNAIPDSWFRYDPKSNPSYEVIDLR